MIKGYLKYFVLKFLDKEDMTGYSLMKRLKEVAGKKPSPGSMYPLLKDLEKEGYVTVRKEGRTKVYSITKKGKEFFKKFKKEKDSLFKKVNNSMSALAELCGSTEQEFIRKISEHMKKGDNMMRIGTPEMLELKKTLLELVQSEKYEQNEAKIKKILKETNKKLNGLR